MKLVPDLRKHGRLTATLVQLIKNQDANMTTEAYQTIKATLKHSVASAPHFSDEDRTKATRWLETRLQNARSFSRPVHAEAGLMALAYGVHSSQIRSDDMRMFFQVSRQNQACFA
jgi:hypothetical protein